MDGVRIDLVGVVAPAPHDFIFEKTPTAKVTMRASINGSEFDIAIVVNGHLDAADLVVAARHKLHECAAALAEHTKHWALAPQWFAERLPAQPGELSEEETIPF